MFSHRSQVLWCIIDAPLSLNFHSQRKHLILSFFIFLDSLLSSPLAGLSPLLLTCPLFSLLRRPFYLLPNVECNPENPSRTSPRVMAKSLCDLKGLSQSDPCLPHPRPRPPVSLLQESRLLCRHCTCLPASEPPLYLHLLCLSSDLTAWKMPVYPSRFLLDTPFSEILFFFFYNIYAILIMFPIIALL